MILGKVSYFDIAPINRTSDIKYFRVIEKINLFFKMIILYNNKDFFFNTKK
jgi:hypothetical protein